MAGKDSSGVPLRELDPRDRYKLLCGVIVPRPIALVTTLDENGAVNAAPFSFFNVFSEDPPLVVLDIILPKKNGFQVCRQLKSSPDTSGIKVILVSSKNQDSDKFWGMKQGADDYIGKPYQDEVLLAAIARQL